MKRDRVPVINGAFCCGFVAGPGIAPDSRTYHVQHREYHLIRFPKTDAATRQSLDALIAKHTPASATELPS